MRSTDLRLVFNYSHATTSMKSVNFSFLGNGQDASALGKKGTSTDLTLYDKKEAGTIRTWVTPSGFPAKIQPLLQAVNLAEYAILHVDVLDRFAGEQILALDATQKTNGILSHAQDVDHDSVMRAVRGTVVQHYKFAERNDIRLEALSFDAEPKPGDARVVVDHCFDVRGAGTIALGKVAAGDISKYETLRLMPGGIDVLVKSIQMHDDPVDTAVSPARVGLALKGIKHDQIRRGDILCSGAMPEVGDTIKLDFAKVAYYKGEPAPGQMCIAAIGLQAVAGKFATISPLTVKLDRQVAYQPGERCVLLKPDAPIRIMGSGAIL